MALSNKFEERENQGHVRNYGSLLVELSQTVPDGIVCLFTSNQQMKYYISQWSDMKILSKVLENKLISVETAVDSETHDDEMAVKETALAVHDYKLACDSGRGGILFCTARGWLA